MQTCQYPTHARHKTRRPQSAQAPPTCAANLLACSTCRAVRCRKFSISASVRLYESVRSCTCSARAGHPVLGRPIGQEPELPVAPCLGSAGQGRVVCRCGAAVHARARRSPRRPLRDGTDSTWVCMASRDASRSFRSASSWSIVRSTESALPASALPSPPAAAASGSGLSPSVAKVRRQ